NVLETTFKSPAGSIRVSDAMTVPGPQLAPFRELQRRVEGLSGTVPISWRVEPRFGYGCGATRIERRGGVVVATAGADAIAICTFDCGEPRCDANAISGVFEAR